MNATSILITAEGEQEPKGHHLMVIDGRCALIDLSGVDGSLHDASINRVEWGRVQDGKEVKPGGYITRVDGSRAPFFDKQAILPYVTAFEAELERRGSTA